MNTRRQIVRPLSRRTVLRGLGASLALPWLDIMHGSASAAQAVASAASAVAGRVEPARLACFYIPGAINHYNWFPADEGRNYTIAPTHKPLEHLRDQFSILSNLLHIQAASAASMPLG